MPDIIDLHDSTIASHWSRGDEGVSAILDNMQVRESWVLDECEGLKLAMIDWASCLTDESLKNIVENNSDDLIRILAFMKSKRSLFLLDKIENRFPGVSSELLMDSLEKIDNVNTDTRPQRVLRDRLVALYRIDLLERIFSVERSDKIKKAIRLTSEKYGGIYE